MPLKGALDDKALEIVEQAGILLENGKITKVGSFKSLKSEADHVEFMDKPMVALPGFIDAHTHICFAGSRSSDFSLRNSGVSYQEIAAGGGGIWSSVRHTREASKDQLIALMTDRLTRLAKEGVTTVEVKSGYGLSVEHELKMLQAINEVKEHTSLKIIPTCLAAHIIPKDFDGSASEYLANILSDLVPQIEQQGLCNRFDIFIEENAFDAFSAKNYLNMLSAKGFDLTVHGDQFSVGGSKVAVEAGAASVDHLEVSRDEECKRLANSETVAVVLPGASIGLGIPFSPARKLLDQGCCLAIASDWNPGSAPMGNLLTQAAVLSTYEKLSAAEVFAGITFRAAQALRENQIGKIAVGYEADLTCFPGSDYREILYNQGGLKPLVTFQNGTKIN